MTEPPTASPADLPTPKGFPFRANRGTGWTIFDADVPYPIAVMFESAIAEAVAKKLKELPVDDDFAQGGKVLENGRMVHDLYLFEVKKPSESKKPWDYYKQLAVVPGDKAFPAAKDSGCPLVK